MTGELDKLAVHLEGQGDLPPLHLWHPPLSGDIDILIRANGEWQHEGAPIQRHSLVRLFASILRREDDGEYYLVTPVEKWRIQVEDQPLQIVDFEIHKPGTDQQQISVTTNVDRIYTIGERYPLRLLSVIPEGEVGDMQEGDTDIPVVELDNQLKARFSRAAWYRLIDAATTAGRSLELLSDGQRFVIGRW